MSDEEAVATAKMKMHEMLDAAREQNKDPMQTLLAIGKSKVFAACKPRIVLMINSGDCEACEPVQQDLSTLINRGIIDEVEIASDEGQRIMEKNEDIKLTPTLCLLDCDEISVQEIFYAGTG